MDFARLGFVVDPAGTASGVQSVQSELRKVDSSAKQTQQNLKDIGHHGGASMGELAEKIEGAAGKLGPLGRSAEEALQVFGKFSGVFSVFAGDTASATAGQAALDAAFAGGTISANTFAAAQARVAEAANVERAANEALSASIAKQAAIQSEYTLKLEAYLVLRREASRLNREIDATAGSGTPEALAREEAATAELLTVTEALKVAKQSLRATNYELSQSSKLVAAGASEEALAQKELGAATKLAAEGSKVQEAANFSILGSILTLLPALLALALAYEGVKTAFEAIGAGAKHEDLEFGLGKLIGDAHIAHEMLEQLEEIAGRAPLKMDALVTAATRMTLVGIGTADTTDRISRLGDIASTVTGNVNAAFESLAQQYEKVRVKNALTLKEIGAWKDAGFDLVGALASSMGKDETVIRDLIKQHKIGWDEVDAAIVKATSSGGKYFQAMAERAGTLNSLMIVLGNQWDQVLVAFGKPLAPAIANILEILKPVLATLKEIAGYIGNQLASAVKYWGDALKAAIGTTGIGDVMEGLVQKAMNFADVFTSILKGDQFGVLSAAWDVFVVHAKNFFVTAIGEAIASIIGMLKDQTISSPLGDFKPFGKLTVPEGVKPTDTTGVDNALTKAVADSIAKERANRAGPGGSGAHGEHTKPLGPAGADKGGGGGSKEDLSDYEKEWIALDKAIKTYNDDLGRVDDGTMTLAETSDHLAATLKKIFDKAYNHQEIDEWIEASLTGYDKVKAKALNFDAARTQSAKRADEDIKLGIASNYDSMVRGIQKATESYRTFSQITEQIAGEITSQFASGFASAFMAFATGAKSAKAAFLDFAKSFLNSISEMIIKALILKAINYALGFASGSTDANGGGLSNSYSFKAAGGFVGGPGPTVTASPDMFLGAPHYNQGGGVGIIAHAGELILNQAQQNNVASAMGGGGTMTFNLTVNNSGGASDENDRVTKRMVKELPAFVKSVIAKEKRQGGILARTAK